MFNWFLDWLRSQIFSPTLESKVVAGAVGAAGGGFIADMVKRYLAGLPIPEWIKTLIVSLIPVISSFASGYAAPHTVRIFSRD